MGLFDFFKKKEIVVNNPIVETKNDDPIKKVDVSIEGNKETPTRAEGGEGRNQGHMALLRT